MAYGLHWEWRGFGTMPSPTREAITQLPTAFPDSRRDDDEYLWTVGLKSNIKYRPKDETLKFKRLVREHEDKRFQLWKEDEGEEHKFPLSPAIFAKLASELGLMLPLPSEPVDHDKAVSILKTSQPEVYPVAVSKVRRAYRWAQGSHKVLIELAEISAPEVVTSVQIEDDMGLTEKSPPQQIDEALAAVRAAKAAFRLGDGLVEVSYLNALEVWVRNKKLTELSLRRGV